MMMLLRAPSNKHQVFATKTLCPIPLRPCYSTLQERKRKAVLETIALINADIIRMYNELVSLEMTVDIDMSCYLDQDTNQVVCVCQ